MAKKALIIIFLWLFLLGQTNGISGVSGDINMIDEGQFAAWVNHMLHGKIVYKEFFVQYAPLQVYPLYFLMKIFGPSMFFIRLWHTVIGVFLGLCVALLTLKYLKVRSIIFAITTILLVLIPGIHIRYWIGILCLLIIVQAHKSKSVKLAFITGILFAISFFESIEVGIFSMCTAAGFTLIKRNIRIMTFTFFGFILSIIIFAPIAFREGWLISYLKTNIDFITSISGINLPNGQGLPNIFEGHKIAFFVIAILQFLFSKEMLFYWSLLLILIFLAVIIIRYILKKLTKEDEVIFLILCFGLFIYASIVGRSGHYFLVVPIVLISLSYFLSLIFSSDQMKDRTGKILKILFLFLFILYGIRHIIIFRHTQFFSLTSKTYLNISVSRVAPIAISKSQANDIFVLQDFFNNNTKKTDTIFVFNNLPALYFLLDRENSTQYDLPLLANSREKRLGIVSELRHNPPLFIIEDKNAWAVDGVSDRKRLPEVVDYIKKQYFKFKTIYHFILYKKK